MDIRKGVKGRRKVSLPTNLDSNNIETNIKLRSGQVKDKLSDKKKSNKEEKNVFLNSKLRNGKVKGKLSEEKEKNKKDGATPKTSANKITKTNIEFKKEKVKHKFSKNKDETTPTNSASKISKSNIELKKIKEKDELSEKKSSDKDEAAPTNSDTKLRKGKGKGKLSEKKKSIKEDKISLTNSESKITKTNIKLKKDKRKGKFSENLSFIDIEKKIYEDLHSPVNENILNCQSQLNKKKNSNKQLHKPSCSKTDEKPKSKRDSKTLQNNSSISKKIKAKKNSKVKFSKSKEIESSSDESDWEDVDELHEILKSKENKPSSSGNIQIELKAENPLWGITKRKRRSEREKIEDYLRKEINKSIREVHENMHKTHLLCLLAHGMYLNSLLCSETLISCALSIIPKQYYSPKRIDINHLEKFVNWFYSHMKVKTIKDQNFIAIPETSASTSKTKGISSSSSSKSETKTIPETSKSETKTTLETETIEDVLIKRFENKSPTCFKEIVLLFVATSRAVGMTVRYVQSLTPISWKPPTGNLLKPKKETDNEAKETLGNTNLENPEKIPKKKSRKMLSSDSEPDDKDSKQKRKKKKINDNNSSEDSDFDLSINFRRKGNQASKIKRRKSNENDSCYNSKKGEIKDWAEVYVEEEEKWIPVDVTRNQIHCANEIEGRTCNLAYVVAFNPDKTVKDVTKRYMSSWLSYNNKVRLDNKWWSDALKPFSNINDKRDKEEDKEMDDILKLQPLPKTINEYKNHPLYALQRHLLKFEAIYPPDESPVGFIRGEPVYPRESIKNLGGRDKWIKEAKTVRVNEEPYKIVKALPKWDRSTYQLIKDRPLELFGEWQVEDYEPPIAKNGRVPRNEYGNVDLFKPCMLPRGCVHLPINGLNRVARKINIDCAPAITGFDYHSGFCHPVYDGFIVCEEFKDILLDAWNQEQMEQAKKEEEKRCKRIYDNWKRLINGITLKERLQERYGIKSQDISVNEKHSQKKEPIKKIKQKDLDELPRSIITHSIANVRIDFESSVTDGLKKKRTVKRKLISNENKSSKKNTNSLDKSLQSSDSEDISDTEKRKKIRSILDWNPNNDDNQSDPALSDDSGDDSNIAEDRLKNSSLMLTPISESNSNKKSCSTKKSTKRSKKSAIREDDGMVLSSSDSEDVPNSLLSKRRSLRATKSKQNYSERNESPSDISVGDSDTGDATYHPTSD